MKRPYLIAAVIVLLLIAFAVASYVYNSRKAEQAGEVATTHAGSLVRDYSPTIGSEDARVILVEFFDPGCETCKAFHPFVKQLMDAHPGRIKLVMRYTPFHDGSDYVSKILQAAKQQGKFWETLDAVYIAQEIWADHRNPQPEKLWMRLGGVDIDIARLKADMESPEIAQIIEQDIADGRQLQVRATPTFFVNGAPLVSFGYEPLKKLVEDEVRKQYP